MREKYHFTRTGNNLNDSGFLIGNHGGQKEVKQYFSSVKNGKPRISSPAKTPFRGQRDIEPFSDGGQPGERVASRPALKEQFK